MSYRRDARPIPLCREHIFAPHPRLLLGQDIPAHALHCQGQRRKFNRPYDFVTGLDVWKDNREYTARLDTVMLFLHLNSVVYKVVVLKLGAADLLPIWVK
jgi:hypothetical protein